MSRIMKLTPDLLKQIIKEEKEKLKNQSQEKSNLTLADFRDLKKIMIKEARLAKRLKALRETRRTLKNKILKK